MCILQVFIYLGISVFPDGWILQSIHNQKGNSPMYAGSTALFFWHAAGNKALGLPVPSPLSNSVQGWNICNHWENGISKYLWTTTEIWWSPWSLDVHSENSPRASSARAWMFIRHTEARMILWYKEQCWENGREKWSYRQVWRTVW